MIRAMVVFAAAYLLIAARRWRFLHIGRPAGALVGAVTMVLVGVLTPAQAFAAVDLRTLGLLFGMMVLCGYLDEAGLFSALSAFTLRRCASPSALLGAVVWVSGLAAAFLMNDTVCLMMTPVVAALVTALDVDPLPYFMALATSANIGSVATLAGNPQNMLIGTASGIPYRQFLMVMSPIALACLALNHFLLLKVFSKRLGGGAVPSDMPPSRVRRPMLSRSLLVLTGVVAAWLIGTDLAFTAVAGASLVILFNRFSPSRILARLDWTLLLFFAALFVVIGGVEQSGALGALTSRLPVSSTASGIALFSVASVLGSNLFSNVPFVMAAGKWVSGLPHAELHWYVLALTSTFAGNLTLVGSMANLIVVELARGVRPIGFREYARYGAIVTVGTAVLGVLYLVALANWFPTLI